MDVVVEQRLIARFPDGRTTQMTLRVGRPSPYRDSDREWVCPVHVEGISVLEAPTDIHGEGSVHALVLGLGFLRFMLLAEAGRGVLFQWADSDEPVDIKDLFGDASGAGAEET